MQKRKSVFRLRRRVRIACESIPWSAQGDPKIKEKTWHISEPTFLIKKCKNMTKQGPKRCPKGWVYFRGGGLGGALDGIIWFLISKMIQKCSTSVQKWCKSAAKVPPGTENYFKNDPKGEKHVSKRASKKTSIPLSFWTLLVRKCEAQYKILHDRSPGPADCAKRLNNSFSMVGCS